MKCYIPTKTQGREERKIISRRKQKGKQIERKNWKRTKSQSKYIQMLVYSTNIQPACCTHSATFHYRKENIHFIEKKKKEISKSELFCQNLLSFFFFDNVGLDQCLQSHIHCQKRIWILIRKYAFTGL